MKLTLKDFATYRGAITARAKTLLAEAQGVRWYRCAGWIAGVIGFVAGLGNWVGLIPAKYSEYAGPVAGTCAFCAMLAPRATRAAGILKVAYGQKRPLLPVLLEVAQVFANPTAIIAEAKKAALDAEAEQAQQQSKQTQQEQAALIEAAVVKVVSTMSGVYLPGQLSEDVPDALKQQPAPAAAPPVALVEAMPIATGPVATPEVGD